MIKYLAKVLQLVDKCKSFEVVRIPRTKNTKADVLSKLAASGYTALGNICMEFLKKSSIECEVVEVMQVDNEPCWMDEIIDYLREGKLSGDKKEACKVVQKAVRFSHDGENLYKRSYTLSYLKCLRPSDASYSLQETHEGICGEHLGSKALSIKVLLRGLYWPTLRQDALDLVKKCERCKKFSPTIHQPAVPMAAIVSPLPFAIRDTSHLITDIGKQFESHSFRKFCSDLKIEQRFTYVAHPQTNGQTEVTNMIILQGIKKRLDDVGPDPREAGDEPP
ncbi:uncharacterized protein LOC143888195 [Tasmannia lanceolata]|uniref:uncharacterized protein LOC143888195 n=1 Tax=Tasmannia lanceolata TaxID=3420 RepID=UPI004063541B